jgi:acireductone synthase
MVLFWNKDFYIFFRLCKSSKAFIFLYKLWRFKLSISGYFDTNIGNKKDEQSYVKIAKEIGFNPSEILFLSDNPDEIIAAASAGYNVIRLVRPLDAEYIDNFPYKQVESFDEIEVRRV